MGMCRVGCWLLVGPPEAPALPEGGPGKTWAPNRPGRLPRSRRGGPKRAASGSTPRHQGPQKAVFRGWGGCFASESGAPYRRDLEASKARRGPREATVPRLDPCFEKITLLLFSVAVCLPHGRFRAGWRGVSALVVRLVHSGVPIDVSLARTAAGEYTHE